MAEILYDPYEGIDWDTVEHHKAAWHNQVREDIGTAHELIDMYVGEGPDPAGNTLQDGEEYTVFAAGNKGTQRMLWPWDELSDIDPDYENRDPEDLGVIAFPAAEIQKPKHVCSLFSTVQDDDIDSDFDTSLSDHIGNILAAEDKAVPNGEHMTSLAHPLRNEDKPAVHRIHKQFYDMWIDHSMDDGHIGVAAANKESGVRGRDVRFWDKLLTRFAPHRMIWGFGEDDPYEYRGIGEDVAMQITTLLLDESEFDPSDQSGSRKAAAEAFREGRSLFHDRADYDASDPPTYAHINSIDIDGTEITLDVEDRGDYTIHWFSNGREVGRGSSFEIEDKHFPYVRAEMRTVETTTYTQPWAISAPRAETGDATIGDVQS